MIASPPTIHGVARPVRVLIVEDDPSSRWALNALLRRLGFECRTAEDGTRALEMVRTFRPEIILMDLMMPGLDGLETTRRLKADASTKVIPVLALTANATPSGVLAAKNAGCDDFMTKPVVLDNLVEWLWDHVQR